MNTRYAQADGGPPDDGMLAAEYVLGVLDAHAHRQARARVEADAAFARAVVGWESRLAPLVVAVEPVEVPAHVWPRLRTRLGWSPVQGARRDGLWNSIGFWRGATAAGFAAAAALAVVSVMRAPVPTPAPPPVATTPAPLRRMVTTLVDEAGRPLFLAAIDARSGRMTLTPVPTARDAQGRVPELWLIPAGQAPRSLGVVDTATAREIDVPVALRDSLATGSTLAVSLEPAGGAPRGAPTGPIIATGGIQRL